jgi:quinol monooxygenase YgiN
VIHVIATIQVNPGTRDTFLKEFLRLTPLVRAEVGCIEYGATIDATTPIAIQECAGGDTVIVIEKWASVEALQAHTQAPHMADYRERVKDLVKGVKLLITRPVE